MHEKLEIMRILERERERDKKRGMGEKNGQMQDIEQGETGVREEKEEEGVEGRGQAEEEGRQQAEKQTQEGGRTTALASQQDCNPQFYRRTQEFPLL